MLRDLVIIGASGFGREVACLVDDINNNKPTWNLLGLADDRLEGQTIEEIKIIGTIKDIYKIEPRPLIAIAIADSSTRKHLVEKLGDEGFQFATLVHPTVSTGKKVSLGEGTIVCMNTIFTTNIDIGRHCIINVNCSVGHDTKVEDFVSIMSHTAIAGDVLIGRECYFGLNCTVINKISIGEFGTYGAGSVVVSDMPSDITAVGVPARVVKGREAKG